MVRPASTFKRNHWPSSGEGKPAGFGVDDAGATIEADAIREYANDAAMQAETDLPDNASGQSLYGWYPENGTNFLKSASASMYIRNASGHTESSGTITLWDDGVSTAGDYYEVFITRETTITTTVNTVVNGSAFWIEAYG